MTWLRVGMAVLALGGLGCAADESPPTLGGLYALETPEGCVWIYSFKPKERIYAFGEYCDLESGATGAEIESGYYAVDEDRIFFMPDETSCDEVELRPYDAKFRIYDNGDLFLAGGSQAEEYVKVPEKEADSAGGSGGITRLGCWDGDDFTFYDE